MSGTAVEGRIIGFLAGRNSPSVQPEPPAFGKAKGSARRPVFRYPTSQGATDSLDGRSSTGGFLLFGHYDSEKVSRSDAGRQPSKGAHF